MDKIVNFLNKIPNWLQLIGFPLAIVMFAAAGLLMMTGRNNSEKAKVWTIYICIGLGIIFLGAELAKTIMNAAK